MTKYYNGEPSKNGVSHDPIPIIDNVNFNKTIAFIKEAVDDLKNHPHIKCTDESKFPLSGLPSKRYNFCESILEDPQEWRDDLKSGAPDAMSSEGRHVYLYGYSKKQIENYILFNLNKAEQKLFV